jgi:hypothetical protein
MSKFVSAHIIACMTRQDVERLVKRFAEAEREGVKALRVQCDTVSGRMVCEWEAPDLNTLVEWLKKRNVNIRGSGEWIMRVQLEAVEGKMVTSKGV